MTLGIRPRRTAIPPQFIQRFDILCCRKSSVAPRCDCVRLNSFDCSACRAVLSVRGAKDRRHDRDRYRIVWHDQCQHFRGPRLRGISVEGVRRRKAKSGLYLAACPDLTWLKALLYSSENPPFPSIRSRHFASSRICRPLHHTTDLPRVRPGWCETRPALVRRVTRTRARPKSADAVSAANSPASDSRRQRGVPGPHDR
jgi:hypothetical protein